MTRGNKKSWKIFNWIATNFYLWKKSEKPFNLQKTDLFKEIAFGSLIMHREGWKLNPTTPLIHPTYNGYPRAYNAN